MHCINWQSMTFWLGLPLSQGQVALWTQPRWSKTYRPPSAWQRSPLTEPGWGCSQSLASGKFHQELPPEQSYPGWPSSHRTPLYQETKTFVRDGRNPSLSQIHIQYT